MSDEVPAADDKPASWWRTQCAQFKKELDALNPRLNQADARIAELEAALKAAGEESQTQARSAADWEAAFQNCNADLESEKTAHSHTTLKAAGELNTVSRALEAYRARGDVVRRLTRALQRCAETSAALNTEILSTIADVQPE